MPGWKCGTHHLQLLLLLRPGLRGCTMMASSGGHSRLYAVEPSCSPHCSLSSPFYFTSKEDNACLPETANVWPFLTPRGDAHSMSVTLNSRVQAARLYKSLGKQLSEVLPGMQVLKLISYIPGKLRESLERGFLILDPQSCSHVQNNLYSLVREHEQHIQVCTYRGEEGRVWRTQWQLDGQDKQMERSEVVRVDGPEVSPFVDILRGSAVFDSLQDTLSVLQEISTLIPEAKKLLEFTDLSNMPEKGPHPVIVIEGLDATGKSTLTECLKHHLKSALLRSPPDSISQWRKTFDGESSLIKRAYYALGNYIGAQEIARASQVSPVIVDRYWHSTSAYAIATEIGGGIHCLPPHHHHVYHWPEDLLKPDLVILLTVCDSERIRRIRGRGLQETQEEKELEANAMFRQKVEEAYRRMQNPACVVVDASATRETVLKEALRIIKRHCGI
ncbi:UMP-CMP kinase 2, mitochondrial [Hyperolius riggenbachi]|uniref:UMP-CMP kinase 2, mitochondrial n=1 Tax=Hyperolius riggenbachi TaxID=752182 RepID=UPI0035A36F62